MTMNFSPAIIFTYGLLALAICALWLAPVKLGSARAVPPWLVLFALACASGVSTGLVLWQGLVSILVFGALAYAARQAQHAALKLLLMIVTGVLVLAMALHRLPGFVNPAVVTDVIVSAGAPAVTHRLNFDTATAGLILFALFCVPARSRAQWRQVGSQSALIIGVPLLVLAIATLTHFVRLDFKLLAYTPFFLITNLLFTCVTEEAFFRGYIQEYLSRAMRRWKAGPVIALVLASILFGLAHARGGSALVAMATVAGLGYGVAYLRSGRIEAAILTHLALNGLHFIAFTYPRLGH